MKTTLEIPDSLYRKAKSTAARRGQTVTGFITSAVEAKLAAGEEAERTKPWMEFAGVFVDDRAESKRILRRIEGSCERIDPGQWD